MPSLSPHRDRRTCRFANRNSDFRFQISNLKFKALDPVPRTIANIQTIAAALERRPDSDLQKAWLSLRETRPDRLDPIQPLALLREAIRRTRGLAYYDVQLRAGLVLSSGRVAEMQTGEGKTIVAAIPALLGVLRGQRVHVATPNAYLARRDCEQLRPAFEMLGLSVGLLPERPGPAKQAAYDCDVTYGTGYEFGFDLLRARLEQRRRPKLPLGRACLNSLRGHVADDSPTTVNYDSALAIIDEIDSVLIDEAQTPLVLAEAAPPDPAATTAVHAARQLADSLAPTSDFEIDRRQVTLTAAGRDRVYAWLADHPLAIARPWSQYVEQSLSARHLLRRDVDYVVRDNRIQIVDQNTGRIFSERSWRAGLHQAVEAREGVPITGENATVARITRQRFFQLYSQLCGMTGTATGAERELATCYQLAVTPIPPHRPSRRQELPDRFFASTDAKFAAIIESARERQRLGQPVLIGTRTIADSRRLADQFAAAGLEARVLNGLQDETEADLIAAAGRAGTITIATNMAGRGTDIQPDSAALAAGGLHVIGVERHESRRIDRQLAGRAARQGDPGSSQFFVSADDLLLVRHAPAWSERLRTRGTGFQPVTEKPKRIGWQPMPRGESAIARLQAQVERQQFEQRRQLMQQDRWLDSVLETLAREP